MSDLKALSDAATQGIWGQFGLSSGPWQSAAKAERKAKNFAALDSSHHMSAVIDGKPKRLSEWKHADDAAFAEALVNAYRAGTLVDADLPPKVKALVWVGVESDCFVHCEAFGATYELQVLDTLERSCDYSWSCAVTTEFDRGCNVEVPPQSPFSEAKAAAQAHHEARVLAYLEASHE